MKTYQNSLNLLGRLLIAALFLPAGLSKLANYAGTVGYFTSLGLPVPELTVVLTIVVEVCGSLALIIGYRVQFVSLILAAFTLVASIVGHAYWAAPADQVFVAQLLFFKNIAVIGGLLMLSSTGSGRFSLDGYQKAQS